MELILDHIIMLNINVKDLIERLKKGDLIRVTFFTRANGFTGGGYRILYGRCMFLKQRSNWIVLHFCVISKYIRFFFVLPLTRPLVTQAEIVLRKKICH